MLLGFTVANMLTVFLWTFRITLKFIVSEPSQIIPIIDGTKLGKDIKSVGTHSSFDP